MSNPLSASAAAQATMQHFVGTKRYLAPLEAAGYLGIGHSTLSIHRMNGTGPVFIKWGTNVRYDVLELDRWMAERAVVPVPSTASVSTKGRVGRPRKHKPEGK